MNSKHSPSHDGFDPEDDLDDRPPSRSMLKRASLALQELGQQLLDMPASRLAEIDMPERLRDALDGYKTTRSFEGKRRQMQYVGKLMRKLDPEIVEAARTALEEQHKGSATEKLRLHLAEQWRDRLIADDATLPQWMDEYPNTDTQQLRALIRQARKDAPPVDKAAVSQGLAPRKGRAYRELFQLVREHLGGTGLEREEESNSDEDSDD